MSLDLADQDARELRELRQAKAKLAVMKGREDMVREMLERAGENPDRDGVCGALRRLIERAVANTIELGPRSF